MLGVCPCGFEYGDFVETHQIPVGAHFECPECQDLIEMRGEEGELGAALTEESRASGVRLGSI